ncbi:hypothetical protein [Streptomyces sp. KL116D]|uniref:hypothetical protein n=1 Tax=Streptomyces sp. KL116D TaxID=3045152 RepID=UPI0035574907
MTGEGLQHGDGHSHLLAATNPAAVSHDAAFAYEIAVIVQTACAACTASVRERLLLPDRVQRGEAPAGHARGAGHRGRASSGASTGSRAGRTRRRGTAVAAAVLRYGPSTGRCAQELLAADWACGPTCGR